MLARFLSFSLPPRSLVFHSPAKSTLRIFTMSTINADLEGARARLIEEMKIDVLTGTQEADNEKARREVARSFVCM